MGTDARNRLLIAGDYSDGFFNEGIGSLDVVSLCQVEQVAASDVAVLVA